MYKYPKAIREPPPPPMKKDSRVQHVLKKTKTKMEVSISGFQSPRRARTGAIILSNGWAGMIRGEMTRKHSASHFQDRLGGGGAPKIDHPLGELDWSAGGGSWVVAYDNAR